MLKVTPKIFLILLIFSIILDVVNKNVQTTIMIIYTLFLDKSVLILNQY